MNQIQSADITTEDKLLSIIGHVSFIFAMPIIVPLIIFLVQKNSPFVRDHSAQALLFHLIMVPLIAISVMLIPVLIGILLLAIFGLMYVICTITAVISSIKGDLYKYPITGAWLSKL